MMMKPLQIGNLCIDRPVILAPMAGVTDLPFRVLCREQGCGMVCTEMVSAKAITYKNKNTFLLMETVPQERPVSLQLFGSDSDIMAEAARMIADRDFDVLDVNMGCPVPKVVNNGEGSALMKQPELAGRIVRSLVEAIDKPVTVKIRKGFDDDHINAVEMGCCGGQWRCGCCCPRKNERTVLQRKGRLGDHPQGKRSREDSGYRKWRHFYPSGCKADD